MTSSVTTGFAIGPAVRDEGASHRRIVRWILAIGLFSGLLYSISPHFSDVQQFDEEERIGIHLARGDGFLSPFDLTAQAPPTSWCPPIYPGVVGGIYRLMGIRSDASLLALRIFQVFCRTVAAIALFIIGASWFNRSTGILAAALLLIHPLFLRAMGFYWDNYLALAMFLWLIVWAIRLRAAPVGFFAAANFGFAAGLLMLTNTGYALTLPLIWCIAAGVRISTPRGQVSPMLNARRLGLISAMALSAAAALSPWTLRNELLFHRLFFVRDNLNVELWIGNVPESTGWMSFSTLDHHPSRNQEERDRLLAVGETRYFKRCGERFASGFHAAPTAFWTRTVHRVCFAFFGDPYSVVRYPMLPNLYWHGVMIDRLSINLVLSLLGLLGAWQGWRSGAQTAVLLLILGCAAVAPYTVTQMYDRYSLPLHAMLLLPASYLIATGLRLARPNSPSSPSARRADAAVSMPSA